MKIVVALLLGLLVGGAGGYLLAPEPAPEVRTETVREEVPVVPEVCLQAVDGLREVGSIMADAYEELLRAHFLRGGSVDEATTLVQRANDRLDDRNVVNNANDCLEG